MWLVSAAACGPASVELAQSSAVAQAESRLVAGPQAESRGIPPAAKPPSKLVFDVSAKDLGVLSWPEGTSTFFKFKNTAGHSIRVVDMFASCGCSNPRFFVLKDGKPIRESHGRGETLGPLIELKAGEEGELRVRFETQGLGGESTDHQSMITMVTDEKDVRQPLAVFVKAQIERKWDLAPPQVGFDPMGSREIQTREARLFLLTPGAQAPFEARVVSCPPEFTVELNDAMFGQRPYVSIGIAAGPNLPRELLRREIVIEGKFGKPGSDAFFKVTVPVVVPVVGDIQFKPSLFDFQAVTLGKTIAPAVVRLENKDPGSPLTLGAVTMEGVHRDAFKLKITTEKPGSVFVLSLECMADLPESGPAGFNGQVRIATSAKEVPELRIPYRIITRRAPSPK